MIKVVQILAVHMLIWSANFNLNNSFKLKTNASNSKLSLTPSINNIILSFIMVIHFSYTKKIYISCGYPGLEYHNSVKKSIFLA